MKTERLEKLVDSKNKQIEKLEEERFEKNAFEKVVRQLQEENSGLQKIIKEVRDENERLEARNSILDELVKEFKEKFKELRNRELSICDVVDSFRLDFYSGSLFKELLELDTEEVKKLYRKYKSNGGIRKMSVVRKQLSREIRDWAVRRKLIKNGNPKADSLELARIVGILSILTYRNNDKEQIKCYIGDIYITATIMLAKDGLKIEDLEPTQNEFYNDSKNRKNAIYWVINSVGDIAKYTARDKRDKQIDKVKDLLDDLSALAIHHETNLDECIIESWNNNKEEKSYLREDGTFVEEEDMEI